MKVWRARRHLPGNKYIAKLEDAVIVAVGPVWWGGQRHQHVEIGFVIGLADDR